jgi:hypothetical protein
MAKIYGNYNAAQASIPPGAAGPQQESKTKTVRQVFDLALQAAVTTADQLVVGKALKGWAFKGGTLIADATMGAAATLAIGNATTVNKYRTAAVFTAVNTPTAFGAGQAGAFDDLTADEEIIITIAAASLPAAGKLIVLMDYLVP